MDLDAARLLARTHATLLRGLSWHADHHIEGLSAASRHKSLALSNKQPRQLTHLDVTFNWSRHVTATKCEQLITEMLGCLDSPLAATYAATASFSALVTPAPSDVPAPVIKYVAPTPDITNAAPAIVTPSTMIESITQLPRADFPSSVNPQFSSTRVETPAPQVVGSFLPDSVSQAHQEQIVAGDATWNIVGSISVIEEQIGDFLVPHATPSLVTEYVAPEPSAIEHVSYASDFTRSAPTRGTWICNTSDSD